MSLSGISTSFKVLSQAKGQITYALLTRAPLYSYPEGYFLVRLACIRHAASVHSEPGSNSSIKSLIYTLLYKRSIIAFFTRVLPEGINFLIHKTLVLLLFSFQKSICFEESTPKREIGYRHIAFNCQLIL